MVGKQLQELDGRNLQHVALYVAPNIDAQMVFFIGGFKRLSNLCIPCRVKFQELVIFRQDTVSAGLAFQGALAGVRVGVSRSLCGTVRVDHRNVVERLGRDCTHS